jgi:MFS family permease
VANRKALSLLFLANSISGMAQGISMIAIPWYFTVTLGKHVSFGVFYGIITIGSCFWSIYAGSIIDKYDRMKIFQIQSLLGLVLVGFCSWAMKQNMEIEWLFAGIVFAFTSFVYNLHFPNIYAFAQEITPKSNYDKIISFLEIQGQTTFIIGGAIAALLMNGIDTNLSIMGHEFVESIKLSKCSLSEIFMLNTIAYLLTFLIIIQIKYQSIDPRRIEVEGVWQRLNTGWNFLKTRSSLLLYGWLSLALFVCVLLISFYLMPVYVSEFLNAKSHIYASSELFFAIGAMLTGFITRHLWLKHDEIRRTVFFLGLGVLVLFSFALSKNLLLFFTANIVLGFSNASIRYCRISFFWKIVPNDLIGRVSSVLNLSSYFLRATFGFLFTASIFQNAKGIQLVMFVLIIFVCISGLVILKQRLQLLKEVGKY